MRTALDVLLFAAWYLMLLVVFGVPPLIVGVMLSRWAT